MPRRTGSGARSGTNLDASSVAMASKATQSAMDVASSSLVRSLFGGVEGPAGVSASNSSSNNFLLIGLSNITDRVSLPRRKAPKPTHFSISSHFRRVLFLFLRGF